LEYQPQVKKHYSIFVKNKLLKGIPEFDLNNNKIRIWSDLPFIISYIITKETNALNRIYSGIIIAFMLSAFSFVINEYLISLLLIVMAIFFFISTKHLNRPDATAKSQLSMINRHPNQENYILMARLWHKKGSMGQVYFLSRALLWASKGFSLFPNSEMAYLVGVFAGDLAQAFSSVNVDFYSRDLTIRHYNVALEALYYSIQSSENLKTAEFAKNIYQNIQKERDRYIRIV